MNVFKNLHSFALEKTLYCYFHILVIQAVVVVICIFKQLVNTHCVPRHVDLENIQTYCVPLHLFLKALNVASYNLQKPCYSIKYT